jgi:ubiquinone/menaquinone biosynthesis C-methylase UbiE
MFTKPQSICYMSDHVTQPFDLRGVVSPERAARLVSFISQLLGPNREGAKLLDIGCGTGRFTIPLACGLDGVSVTGADASAKMLEQAQAKPCADRAQWSVQNVCSQTFEDGTFDVVFISDMLHHLPNPVDALKECFRVLKPGGFMINKYGAMENIAKDPEHVFFPGTIEVDAERTPTQPMMEDWMQSAGFEVFGSETFHEVTRESAEVRLAGAEAKSISVLHLIDDEQFAEGMRRLSDYVWHNANDPWLLVDPATWTWGRKS